MCGQVPGCQTLLFLHMSHLSQKLSYTIHSPLFFEACELVIDYYSRLESTEIELLCAVFHEQIMLGLPWYTNISKLLTKYNFPHSSSSKSKLSTQISHNMTEEFVNTWKSAKALSPKLEFYNLIKHDFEPEAYLRMIKILDVRKSPTRFRKVK